MATNDDSKPTKDTTEILGEAWDHIAAAIGVLQTARDRADALPPTNCDAVALLLDRANTLLSDLEAHSDLAHFEAFGDPEFVHRITGAIELAKFGSNNDLGDDSDNSGLPLPCVWLAQKALMELEGYLQTALRAERKEVSHA